MTKNKKQIHDQTFLQRIYTILDKYTWLIFFILIIVGLYLRFWHIEDVRQFGWDQARESWSVRDIINGELVLVGYPTGAGHIPIGPLYYYLLVPFYYFSHLDPMGANYANIFENVINFFCIFLVTKKIFNTKAALFAILLYITNLGMISSGQTAWNVSLMPGIAAVIFYSIIKVYRGEYRWIFVMWALSGFYFNFHFTSLFVPFINLASLVFVKNKIKAFLYSIYSIPLYFIWFVPNFIYEIKSKGGDSIGNFFHYYFLGFHLQFLFHQLPYSLVTFKTIIAPDQYFLPFTFFQFFIPISFIITILFFEKDTNKKIFAYLLSLWFIIPLLGFTMYGGQLSEYYFQLDIPMAIFILIYLQQKILSLNYKLVFLIFMTLFWSFYIYQNTKDQWIKPTYGGLHAQKDDVKKRIASGEKIKFNEGDIESYLYVVYTKSEPIKKD